MIVFTSKPGNPLKYTAIMHQIKGTLMMGIVLELCPWENIINSIVWQKQQQQK